MINSHVWCSVNSRKLTLTNKIERDILSRLVVSDFHLGAGETGLQVVAAVREALGPGIKAILTTGDTSMAIQGLARDSSLRIASKPVQADKLLGLIDELLAG